MTARSESVGFKEKTEQGIGTVPVLAAQVIYKGSSVFADATSGYGQTNDGTTITIANGDIFLGIAYEEVDNTDGASGDVDVRYIRENTLLLPISDGSLTQANV